MTDHRPSGFFAMRTPLLPVRTVLDWGEGLEAASATASCPVEDDAVERDRARLRTRLRALVERPEVLQALYVASPGLVAALPAWHDRPDSGRGRAVERALVRYVTRMATRPTPFGLFAGCSVGAVAAGTRLQLAALADYRPCSRVDMHVLDAWARELAARHGTREQVVHRVNSSLYRVGGQVRFVQTRTRAEGRTHHLVSLRGGAHLDAVLARAAGGATLAQLQDVLLAGWSDAAACAGFVDRLVAVQVLVPDLEVAVTGPPPGERSLAAGALPAAAVPAAEALARLRAGLDDLDRDGPGAPPDRYRELARELPGLASDAEPDAVFQVDLVKPARATLAAAVAAEVARAVELMHRLFPPVEHPWLEHFRQAFTARYETREVPLAEALDAELGIGFGSAVGTSAPLVDGLPLPPAGPGAVAGRPPRDEVVRAVTGALATGAREVLLDPGCLEGLAAEEEVLPLPDAFAARVVVAGGSAEAVDAGEFVLWLQDYRGPSGARMLGRFCHADPALHDHVRDHLRAEEALRPDAVFAEVVHLPEGRLGNIIARPVLRDHEIPFLGRSGAPPDGQIPVADLRVSVSGEEIVLRSSRLGRRVLPRMTNHHNHEREGGVYRFLCLLQEQGVDPGQTWTWGPLAAAPFLPRVRVGRAVLALARWRMTAAEIGRLAAYDGAALLRAVAAWRTERGLDRFVVLTERDKRLVVDLENVLSVESFVQRVKPLDGADLTEMWPDPCHLLAHGPEGLFTHELVVPFVRERAGPPVGGRRSADRAVPPARPPAGLPAPRRFPPGSEWLYVKVYAGETAADRVLLDVLAPVVEAATATGQVDRWFFLRFTDPDHHVRIRLHGTPATLWGEVAPALHAAVAPLLESGLVWRVQHDTYEREVERYGGPEGVVVAERLFHADSAAALTILPLLPSGDAGADERWRLTLAGAAALLRDLGLSLDEQVALLQERRASYAREHGADRGLTVAVAERFRRERASLETLVGSGLPDDDPLAPGLAALCARSQQLEPVVAELRRLEAAGTLSTPLSDLAASYLHLHVFRLLRGRWRAHELVLYDFLARLLRSEQARRR